VRRLHDGGMRCAKSGNLIILEHAEHMEVPPTASKHSLLLTTIMANNASTANAAISLERLKILLDSDNKVKVAGRVFKHVLPPKLQLILPRRFRWWVPGTGAAPADVDFGQLTGFCAGNLWCAFS
jgi:hypothetical protein